jgi:hypothetical protein
MRVVPGSFGALARILKKTLYSDLVNSKYTRALTFENACPGEMETHGVACGADRRGYLPTPLFSSTAKRERARGREKERELKTKCGSRHRASNDCHGLGFRV